jgi:predicted nucleic acid-binding protein
MILQLFLDTNVVLDLALNRAEFIKEKEAIFELKEQGKIDIHISSLTLATVAYFADKHKLDTFQIINKFVDWISIVELETFFFKRALASDFLDFEDGLQYLGAKRVKDIRSIITRNVKDFNHSNIPVLTPLSFC